MSEEKAREFWIEGSEWESEPAGEARGFIHVIEYSAYEQLQKENEKLKAELDKLKNRFSKQAKKYWEGDLDSTLSGLNKAKDENAVLREHLRIAVEALNQISRTRTYHVAEGELYRSQALSALNKIKLKET
jgi:predicted RNase H-like nuclease (RuvC/YqgF family)